MDASIKSILKNIQGIKVNGSLWLESADGHFFGPGPVELLERIADTGSISEAAKQMKADFRETSPALTEAGA